MKEQITALLTEYKPEEVEKYAAYCVRLQIEKTKEGALKNPWASHKKAEEFASLFKRVSADGLVFDGKHITLQSTGVSYDYVAYKNKMLIAYPESKIDVSVVNEGDAFSFSKEDGKVSYTHSFTDPFGDSTDKTVKGAYCVIKNTRGEFLTLLSKEEIEKHRKVAKTDSIWRSWFKEMVLKTVIKKACKQHFDDIVSEIEEIDNENYDIDLVESNIPVELREQVENATTDARLTEIWNANKGMGKKFSALIVAQKQFIKSVNASEVKEIV